MKIIAANWVLPISAPPISSGAVAIKNDKIVAIGERAEIVERYPNFEIADYGEAAVLPGFVNAHTHLELTAMRSFLDDVEHDFGAWLKKLTIARGEKMTAVDLRTSAVCGGIEAARGGGAGVADMRTDATGRLNALEAVGLRGIVFQETTGPDKNLARQRIERLREQVAFCRSIENATVKIGISPHAPYSVSPELFEFATEFALEENLPVTIHAAESKNEDDFIRRGAGFFAEFYRSRNLVWRVPGVSPIKYLHTLGALRSSPLLAHCVRVSDEDIELMSEIGARAAHCPKSNAKFAHGIAPLAKFSEKNLAIGLGTDSVASNNVGDILEEARFAALLHRANGYFVEADEILRLATLGGAEALGLEREIGSLETGKQADLIVVKFDNLPPEPIYSPVSAVVFASSARDIVLTMVAGRALFEQNRIIKVDEREWRERLSQTARKLKN